MGAYYNTLGVYNVGDLFRSTQSAYWNMGAHLKKTIFLWALIFKKLHYEYFKNVFLIFFIFNFFEFRIFFVFETSEYSISEIIMIK